MSSSSASANTRNPLSRMRSMVDSIMFESTASLRICQNYDDNQSHQPLAIPAVAIQCSNLTVRTNRRRSAYLRERERDRQRETERERETETETETERDRDRDRERQRQRQRQRDRDRDRDRDRERQRERKAETERDRERNSLQ